MKILHATLLALAVALAPLFVATHQERVVGNPSDRDFDLALELERVENTKAFREGYLANKEALFEHHAGEWLVIVGGLVLPSVDGNPMPTSDLAAALREADGFRPDARQRFVFRVGEEGEIVQHPTLSERPDVAGTLLPAHFGGHFWVTPDGIYVVPAGVSVENGLRIGSGIDAEHGPYMQLALSAPGGGPESQVEIQYASGYSGYAMLSRATAKRLGLHRFEIPGEVTFHESLPKLRRARVHFRLEGTELDVTLPVALKPN